MTDKIIFLPREQAVNYADRIVTTLHALASRELPKNFDYELVVDLEWISKRVSELREGFEHDESYRIATTTEYVYKLLAGDITWRFSDAHEATTDRPHDFDEKIKLKAEFVIDLIGTQYEESMQRTLEEKREAEIRKKGAIVVYPQWGRDKDESYISP